MTPKLIVGAVLLIAALLATWRSHRRGARAVSPSVWAQPLLALSLFAALFPPSISIRDDTLTVLTAGATNAQKRALPSLQRVIALPESDSTAAGIEPLPDLATALRRYPQTRNIVVVGNGLALRDQEAPSREQALRFDAAPEQGLTDLDAPTTAAQGTQWSLGGRALAPVTRVELRDPSGTVVDMLPLPRDGRFRLSALARAPGTARYELRLFDAKQRLVDTAAIPLVITPGEGLSAILRVGAPDPEFKYWRRWSRDAGIATRAAAGLSEGVSIRDGDTRLTAAALAMSDLVIIDERAWTTLDAGEKTALRSAVDDGLGLLLRADGAVEPEVAADWAALGFRTTNADGPHSVTIDHRTGLRDRSAFTAAPVSLVPEGLTPLLLADDGEVLAAWRAEGRGRIGFWRLIDSYRLTLLGEPARYGALWQATLVELSRPKPAPGKPPQLPGDAWVNERSVLCGLGTAASVRAPGGTSNELAVGDQGCAGYWPAEAGWQQLQTGASEFPFYVRAEDDAHGLRTARDRATTLAHVRPPSRPQQASSPAMRDVPLPRWPFFLVWLLLATALWWRERPR